MSLQEIANEQESLSQLEEIRKSLKNLENLINSNNEANNLTIFSELRTLLKEQNLQGNQNLSNNVELLKSNAMSICSNLNSTINSQVKELNITLDSTKNEIRNQMMSTTDLVCKTISERLRKNVSEIDMATKNLKFSTKKNICLSVCLSFSLLVFALLGGMYILKFHDGTKIAEMRIDRMLENEIADIQKKAVDDYKNSSRFHEDSCKVVAENIQRLDTLHYLNKYIKSSTVNEYPVLKAFYKDFIKNGEEQYKNKTY